MTKQELLDKVTKLLALAERAGTVSEAETAMAKVKELLVKYNLSIDDAKNYKRDASCAEESIDIGSLQISSYVVILLNAIKKLFECEILSKKFPRKFIFIGLGADPIIAAQLFIFLKEASLRGAKRNAVSRRDRNCYLNGFATAIYEKVIEIKKFVEEKQEHALVTAKMATIEKYITTNYRLCRSRRLAVSCKEPNAFNLGKKDGKNTGFYRPVETSTDKLEAIGQ
ncbi:MAG: DUF2786 domain-containing protein [Desulfovibrio sp.]|nr:DUF2786 domain-containing protein [Desulfovibrio sp.]